MQVRKTSLRDGDELGGQARVAVNLAPLAGQAPAGPGSDVAGEIAPHESGRNNTTGGEPSGVSNIAKVGKISLRNLRGTMGRKLPVEMSPAKALGAFLAEC